MLYTFRGGEWRHAPLQTPGSIKDTATAFEKPPATPRRSRPIVNTFMENALFGNKEKKGGDERRFRNPEGSQKIAGGRAKRHPRNPPHPSLTPAGVAECMPRRRGNGMVLGSVVTRYESHPRRLFAPFSVNFWVNIYQYCLQKSPKNGIKNPLWLPNASRDDTP